MSESSPVSLREYVDTRFADAQKAVDAAFAAQKEAINAALAAQKEAVAKAESASERRFEGVNEFRATLSDQQRTLIPRSEVQVMERAADERIGKLEKQIEALLSERAGIKGGWGYAVGLIGLILSVLALMKVMKP